MLVDEVYFDADREHDVAEAVAHEAVVAAAVGEPCVACADVAEDGGGPVWDGDGWVVAGSLGWWAGLAATGLVAGVDEEGVADACELEAEGLFDLAGGGGAHNEGEELPQGLGVGDDVDLVEGGDFVV